MGSGDRTEWMTDASHGRTGIEPLGLADSQTNFKRYHT